jgi:hypothetical protein
MSSKIIYWALNCFVCFDIIAGKNGRPIFINMWRRVDDIENCSWEEMDNFCRVKGGY